jgi:hypothetical protein
MKVTLAVRGGLAAAIGPRVRVISPDALDADQERELRGLVSSAAASAPAREVDERAGRWWRRRARILEKVAARRASHK